jgi:hypothetical protein
MTTINNEIEQLRRRLAELEEKKRVEESLPKQDPMNLLEKFIQDKKNQLERGRYSKNVPLAAFYDREKVDFLEPILYALKDIHERLTALESKP